MTNNNQVMLDEVKVENDNKVRSEQLEKLLGNSKVPIVVPAQLPLPRTEPRDEPAGVLQQDVPVVDRSRLEGRP
jgi:hypothetical protein